MLDCVAPHAPPALLQFDDANLTDEERNSTAQRKTTLLNARGSVTGGDPGFSALMGVVVATGNEDTLPAGHQFAQLPANVQVRAERMMGAGLHTITARCS